MQTYLDALGDYVQIGTLRPAVLPVERHQILLPKDCSASS